MDGGLALLGAVANELALFAAAGFLLFGIDDLVVDAIYFARTFWRRIVVYTRHAKLTTGTLRAAPAPGGFAVLVPAWDEGEVIGSMLRHALAAWGGADVTIFVGCYPNDPATHAAVAAIADPRVRCASVPVPGPTTKADCLNALYRAMREDEQARGRRYAAAILHDAEDVVHPRELDLFAMLIGRAGLIQLPVMPLIDAGSRWIAGHYADEFAESHGKEMVVREAVGAALPSAGVACAIRRDALDALAELGGGEPFNPLSLTEDYELGLRLHALGYRAMFVRLPAEWGREVVATREHFPATLDAAVRQKARWMAGIALTGWDRLGWRGGLAERWMRARDRRGPLCALLIMAGYLALLLWGAAAAISLLGGPAVAGPGPALQTVLAVNVGLLWWRLLMRAAFVARAYGWRESLRSIPRVFIANAIAMLAARRAVGVYLDQLRTGRTHWDKTRHRSPDVVPAA